MTRAETAAEVESTPGRLELGMVGHYLQSDRHKQFRRLLESKAAQHEAFL